MTDGQMIGTSPGLPVSADTLENPKHEQFAILVCEGYSATDAYRQAFAVDPESVTPGTVRKNAMRLRHSQAVADRIKHLQATVATRSVMSTAELVADLEQMAVADINELVRFDSFACRHCYGKGHAYQWIDAAELARALDEYGKNHGATPLPSAAGGFGFVPTGQPAEFPLIGPTQFPRLGTT